MDYDENIKIMCKKVSIVFLLFLIGISLQCQIINKGDLRIESGTSVYLGENFTNEATGTMDTEGNIHVNGDFTNDGFVSSTNGTTYFNSSSNATQNLSGASQTVQFYNLEVNNTAVGVNGLAVADGFNLKVTNGVGIYGGKLRLMGESQLLQLHNGTSLNTGTGHLLIDQQGAKNAYRYNYWSSPVQADAGGQYQVQNILKDGSTPNQFFPSQIGLIAAPNGTDATTPIQISTRWLYKYINAPLNGGNGVGWASLYNLNTLTPSAENNVLPTQGYIMKGTNASAVLAAQQNYSFEGVPNDGDYSLTLLDDREYLVGNPYPSALDSHAFINDNLSHFDGTLYFWEHWSTNTHVYVAYGGGYAALNISGGVVAPLHPNFSSGTGTGSLVPQRYIPVGQGFVIRSETTSGGSIGFRNSQRVFEKEGANSVFFRLNRTAEDIIQSRIRLDYIAPDEAKRSLLLAFTDGTATDAFDRGFDGKMIEVMTNDLYFTMPDAGRNDPYVIQGADVFDTEKMYPLVLQVGANGTHKIQLQETENFTLPVYILDLVQQSTHDLTQGDFEISLNAGLYENRFRVVFKPFEALDLEHYLNQFVQVYYHQNEIIIDNSVQKNIKSLKIYNVLGQLVYENIKKESLHDVETRIPFNFAQATYVIKLESDEGIGTFKIINY
jgi:hypothetical protein